MCNSIRRPVRRQQEAIDIGDERVPLCRSPELKKVKQGQGKEEEGHTPDGAVGEEENGDDANATESQGDAQTESPDGDAGEGLGLARKEGLEGEHSGEVG